MHGVVTTYQQVATSATALRQLASGAFVIFDELHHAGDERAWGAGIQAAFEVASRRLALSGTPFRSDTIAIPFVRYSSDVAQPDFEFGYGEALATGGVVRPVFFPRIDGHMEWMAPDGSLQAAGFADPLDRARAGQRLRTALSLEGEWLPAVLRQAHRQLLAIRESAPDAAGLVIATDQDHARGIGAILRERFGVRATVVTSDDPSASARIAGFGAGTDPWIVAVRMVSEGVDIPRLHVGVYATTTTTELFFRQAVGRIVRWTRGERRQRAYLFIPDDLRLRALAHGIAEQRRHSLVRAAASADEQAEVDPRADPLASMIEPEQLSLFAALSAVAVGEPHEPPAADPSVEEESDDGVEVDLPPLPVAGGLRGVPGAVAGQTLRERKKELRDDNAEQARRIARLTGLTHAQVNRELNRLSGLDRVTEATSEQLERRLRHADGWLRKVLPTLPGLARWGG
jgi:superfamily II DNA or RNA helicase